MSMIVSAPGERPGFDTIEALTDRTATGLGARGYMFVFQYVSLGAPSPGDITIAKRDVILKAGLALGLVQHVNLPGWVANAANGAAHGAAAAAHAQLVGYPAGCHLGLDLEGLGDSGQPVIDHITAWAAAVHAAGFKVLLYVGYCCGLTPVQLAALADAGIVDGFWADYGPRVPPPGYGFVLKQHAQEPTTFGFDIDPDICEPVDLKGNPLVLMAPDGGQWISGPVEDVQPHTDPAGPNA